MQYFIRIIQHYGASERSVASASFGDFVCSALKRGFYILEQTVTLSIFFVACATECVLTHTRRRQRWPNCVFRACVCVCKPVGPEYIPAGTVCFTTSSRSLDEHAYE